MVPLSFAQERIWFLNQVEGMSAVNNLPAAFRLSGALDVGALDAALGDVVVRHEVLRTIFPAVGGIPYQRVLPAAQGRPVLVVAEPGEQDLSAAMVEAAGRGFDLTVDTPLRAWLFAAGPGEHVVMLVFQHIACDGWSAGPLWRDLALAYAARLKGANPQWSPLPVQYGDYAVWQRARLGDVDDPHSMMSQHLAYWRDKLAGLPEQLELPADRPRPATASHRGGTVRFRVDARLHGVLRALARDCRVTMFMVMHAAVAALLTQLGGGTDIPLGSPVAGRADEALDELIGFFVNTLVLRADTSGNPSFREMLSRIRETDLAAYDHQDLPFEKIVQALNPGRTPDRNPLFQVMIAFDDGAGNDLQLTGVRTRREDVILNTAGTLDLAFTFIEERSADGGPGGMDCVVVYTVDLFDQETVERIAHSLVFLLEIMAADPDEPIGRPGIRFPMERIQAPSPRRTAGDMVTVAARYETLSAVDDGVRTALEQTLCGLFAEVLQRTLIEIHDDFFALGGHSLAVIRLIGRIRSVLGVKIGVREFFEEPTVAGVAHRLSVSGRRDPLPPISRRQAFPRGGPPSAHPNG